MQNVSDFNRLIDKLLKIQNLYDRPGSEGEKLAAFAAMTKIKDKIGAMGYSEPREEPKEEPIEYTFSHTNEWSKSLLEGLLRKYNISSYRYKRQKRTTVTARVRKSFCETVLWPEFKELNKELRAHLDKYAQEIITRVIHGTETSRKS